MKTKDPAAAEAAAQAEIARLDTAIKAADAERLSLVNQRAAAMARAQGFRYMREAALREAAEREQSARNAAAAEARHANRADKQRAIIVQLENELNERRKQLPEALLGSFIEKLAEERYNLTLILEGAAL